MSFCASQILQLATNVYADIGSPSNIGVAWVSGYFTSSGNLGTLNNQLTTCMYLSGDSPCIVGMGDGEASIYALNYLNGYYRGLSSSVFVNGTASWTRLREGDSSIERDSASNLAKAAIQLWKENDRQLRIAVANYKIGVSIPAVVDAAPLPSYPTP